ncbi:hypothetical protein FS837_005421 [Tulasnella sp. UAMH 9824]|nr:hypothetical protein FS837_005421 [Tulasnella sp. UAMH 9824]
MQPMVSKVGFPFPFTNFEAYNQDGDTALTLVDLRMIELSYVLRSKPSWWTKIKDPAVRSQWKAEALEYQIRGGKLKEAEIEWVLDELEDYAKMRDEATGIQSSCHVRIWESDNLISEELKAKLIRAAGVLENVPDEEKDWHSRYSDQVLNLVHPSLFCAVYDRTPCWNDSKNSRVLKPLTAHYKGMAFWAYSSKFAWIPTDFQLGMNGAPATALGYINNVHPDQNKDLVTALESLVGRFTLLWDRVLTDTHPDNDSLPGTRKVVGSYTWTDHPKHPKPSWHRVLGNREFNKRLNAWQEHKILSLPTVDKHGYRGSRQDITRRNSTYSIQGKIVQVIIKLANIHLPA